MNHHTTVLFLQVLSIILILSTDSLPKPVASIGAGGGGSLGSYTTNLHLQICKLTDYSLAGINLHSIALQSAPKVGVVIKVGVAQQNIL